MICDTSSGTDDVKSGLPPAIRAEQALLGAVLLDPAGQRHLLDLVAPEDMTRPYHAQVLAAMQRVRERREEPGPLAVHEEVARDHDMPRGLSQDGVPLADLMEAAPRSDHASAYAAMVIGSGIRRHMWLAAGRMSQSAETGDLESALRMTDRARQELEQCSVRWEALPAQVRREMPAPVSQQRGYDQIARLARGVRDEIRRLRLQPELDGHLVEQRLAVVAQKVADIAAASAQLRPLPAKVPSVGEGRPVGPEAEAVGALALRDLAAAPGSLTAVCGWLRPGHFATPEQGELYAVMRDLDAAGHPVDPVTVTWEAARRGIPVDAADLADGVGPFAIASGREVHRRGLLAQIDQAGRDIQADADGPASSTKGFLRAAQGHLARLQPEPQPSHQGQAQSADLARDQDSLTATPRVPAPRQPVPEAVP
jgi:replicative DNA helicase